MTTAAVAFDPLQLYADGLRSRRSHSLHARLGDGRAVRLEIGRAHV